ncbi:hypothetical protein [Spiroplasma tabanidicola]|uniref:Uncharacterized protein n=1 Tax=Spiroplasma tabanidicola TaxID=324079 RepID=A0A6I6C9L1_9MOLU|nr:hypothetical protein [Spiroplasma tabanidicola]QGS51615.1 hypothetical protein STABA_v1c02480 [Spiroplasma tabanidicola]
MKNLLALLSSLSIGISSVGSAVNYVVDDNVPSKNNDNSELNNADQTDNSESKPNTDDNKNKDKRIDLEKVIKRTQLDQVKINNEDNASELVLNAIVNINPSLDKNEVTIQDYATNSSHDKGTATIVANEDSKKYKGLVDINFSIFHYSKDNFLLEKNNVEMRMGETQQIKVVNFNKDENSNYYEWAKENWPEKFVYNPIYIKIEFNSEQGTIDITAKDDIKEPPASEQRVIVMSNDKRPGNQQEIKVQIFAKSMDFNLAKTSVDLKAQSGQTTSILVTNWDDLIEDSNRPDNEHFSYSAPALISARVDYSRKSVIIEATGNIAKSVVLTVGSRNRTVDVTVNLIYPEKQAVFETTSITMTTNSTKNINIVNYDDLRVDENMPSQFSINHPNAVKVSLDKVTKSLKFEAQNVVMNNVEISVWSKNLPNNKQVIKVNITPEDKPFHLDKDSVNLKVYETTEVNISNMPEIQDGDRNIPSKIQFDASIVNAFYNRQKRAIIITAKDKAVSNYVIKATSLMGHTEEIRVNISVPQVNFVLSPIKDMNAGETQIIDVTNYGSLIHEDNYPVNFSFNVNGIVDARYDKNNHKIYIESKSVYKFKRGLVMTVKSKNNKYSQDYTFDVIKRFDLNNFVYKNLGEFGNKDASTITDAFYNKNKNNITLEKEIYDGLIAYDISYSRAKIKANSALAQKWLYGEANVNFKVPLKETFNVETDYTDAYGHKNDDTSERTTFATGTANTSLDNLRRDFSKIKVNLLLDYNWTREYTPPISQSCWLENKNKNISSNFSLYNTSETLVHNDGEKWDDLSTNEVKIYFYVWIEWSDNGNNTSSYKINIKTLAYINRTNLSWRDFAINIAARSKIKLLNVEFVN